MKRAIATMFLLVLVAGAFGCAPANKAFDIENAEKITVFSGATGQSAEITDSDDIKRITDNINSLSFSRDKSSKNQEGFNLYIDWYDADGTKIESLIVMTYSRISYKDYFYDVVDEDKNVDIEFLYSFLDID